TAAGPPGAWQGEVDRQSRDYIRWVQQSLNQLLGTRLSVDGLSGPQTRSALRRFQSRQGLPIDGIVGPQTDRALVAARASPPPGGGSAPAGGGAPGGPATSFRLIPVEVPGGGRIRDKSPPPASDVVSVTGVGGRSVPLHRLAAQAHQALVQAARADGL